MEKIKAVYGWDSYFTLNGHRLRDGEVLKVKFPNKKCVEKKLIVTNHSYRTGACDTASEDTAYLELDVNGVVSRVYLADNLTSLLCERVNAPVKPPQLKAVARIVMK
jgi:hypothetical protein